MQFRLELFIDELKPHLSFPPEINLLILVKIAELPVLQIQSHVNGESFDTDGVKCTFSTDTDTFHTKLAKSTMSFFFLDASKPHFSTVIGIGSTPFCHFHEHHQHWISLVVPIVSTNKSTLCNMTIYGRLKIKTHRALTDVGDPEIS